MILYLPFELYSTFVIEQKHGFNKQTVGLFFYDKLMGFVLSIVIGGPVLSAIIWLINWGGEYFYIYIWSFLLIFGIIMMTIYPTFIQPLFNKFEPLEDGTLKTKIHELAGRVEFPLTKLL